MRIFDVFNLLNKQSSCGDLRRPDARDTLLEYYMLAELRYN